MNHEERNTIARRWMALAATHGKIFNKEAWTMMLDSVGDLPYERLKNALEGWLAGPKARTFPFPIDLREMIVPPVNDDDVAREAASRVIAAVTKFGWAQPGAAKEWVGELGWVGVVRAGGWQYICENLGRRELPHGMFQAQLRDICLTVWRRAKAGVHDQPIALPQPDGQPSLGEAQDVMKMLETRRGMTPK